MNANTEDTQDLRADFQKRCVRFSAAVIRLVSILPKKKATTIIIDQLLRSGTSIGANMREARAAESRADFVHKMQVALKEAGETSYWLEVTHETGFVTDPLLRELFQEANEIAAIIGKSVVTAKRNSQGLSSKASF